MAYGEEDFLLVFGDQPDLSGITKAFDGLADRLDKVMDRFVQEAGLFFQREVKLRPAEGGKMPYRHGTLQLSIQLDPTVRRSDGGGVRYVVVSSGVEYAPYQEFGFRHAGGFVPIPGVGVRYVQPGTEVEGRGFFRHGKARTEPMIEGLLPVRLQAEVDKYHRRVEI